MTNPIEFAAARLVAARAELEDAEAALSAAVRMALETGMSADAIAEQLGVTRQRVYQLRDPR